jgi:hypothetical protein
MVFELAHHEVHRLAFDAPVPGVLGFQDTLGAGSKRTVIQKDNARIEQPVLRIAGRRMQGVGGGVIHFPELSLCRSTGNGNPRRLNDPGDREKFDWSAAQFSIGS